MPYTFEGLTKKDNHNAVAIAKVMANITSYGVQIRLRFGHEANYCESPRSATIWPLMDE
jgi:hypothetical protein